MNATPLLAVALVGAITVQEADSSPPAGERMRVRLELHDEPSDPRFGSLTVEGLAPELLQQLSEAELDPRSWSEVLSLRVAGAPPGAPPILASHVVNDGALLLRPRFLPRGGLELTASFDGARLSELLRLEGDPLPVLEERLALPVADLEPSTVVQAVFPSSSQVPENLLRIYLHFSAPMRAAEVPRHVHLYDARGREVELPFVEVDGGLWDPEQRRLTLFFHPGRVKRGVGPNVALGPPLRSGESYTLVVDRELRDARGLPLAEPFRATLVVGPPDHRSPEPARWSLTPPVGRKGALVVDLDEPVDHALLGRLLTVRRAAGDRVAGSTAISHGERRWSFVPDDGWQAGEYLLEVSPALEDRAGNTPGALFETPTGSGASRRDGDEGSREPTLLPFRVHLPALAD